MTTSPNPASRSITAMCSITGVFSTGAIGLGSR